MGFKNLVGERFGYWEVIQQAEDKPIGKSKYTQRFWKCICHCGYCDEITRDVNESNLKSGGSDNCGKKGKLTKGKNRKHNAYNIEGEFGIGHTLKGEEFYFDLEDYSRINLYFWITHDDGTNKYMRAYKETINDKHVYIFMHNLIMKGDLSDNMLVDHIHGKTLDNRKSELRIVTKSQNSMNKPKPVNNTSGHKGVSYSKLQNEWVAYIACNNVHIHLGTFTHKEDAISARKIAEIKYFGDFNRDIVSGATNG